MLNHVRADEESHARAPVGSWILLAITAAVVYLCRTMDAPFVFALTWSIALAIVAIIHPVDNLLYPILVGPPIGFHSLVLLIAMAGGLIAFGAVGLILGPAIVAVAFALGDVRSHRAVA